MTNMSDPGNGYDAHFERPNHFVDQRNPVKIPLFVHRRHAILQILILISLLSLCSGI